MMEESQKKRMKSWEKRDRGDDCVQDKFEFMNQTLLILNVLFLFLLERIARLGKNKNTVFSLHTFK